MLPLSLGRLPLHGGVGLYLRVFLKAGVIHCREAGFISSFRVDIFSIIGSFLFSIIGSLFYYHLQLICVLYMVEYFL